MGKLASCQLENGRKPGIGSFKVQILKVENKKQRISVDVVFALKIFAYGWFA